MSAITHVLVTGAAGFIGKNLILALKQRPGIDVLGMDVDSPGAALDHALDICEIVYHLAGVNRPSKEAEFLEGNVGSLVPVLEGLKRRRARHPLIVLSSSTQALLDNPYGRSKKRAEDTLQDYAKRTMTPVRIFRLPGVFGKWCRPDYNSVVATFCHNIARDLPIQISDPDKEIDIVHVDDVLAAFLSLVDEDNPAQGVEFGKVEPIYKVSLGSLAEKLRCYRSSRNTLAQPILTDRFDRCLFGTYMSYLPESSFAYELPRKEDGRGALAEFLKLDGHGQIFISRTKPGITRGNHYHNLKVEKFVVMEGDAIIRFRQMDTGSTADYPVSGNDMRVIDIPPGWTHSIENVGAGEMVVLFWSSEVFNPLESDTHAAEVKG